MKPKGFDLFQESSITAAATMAKKRHRPLYMLILATKPCFIKLASLVKAFHTSGIPHILVSSGQHYDDILTGAIDEFDYRQEIAVNIRMRGTTFPERTIELSHSLQLISEFFNKNFPELEVIPLVSGDTFTAGIIPQIWYFSHGTRSIHIEAGLRSYGPKNVEQWNSSDILMQHNWEWVPFIEDPFPEGIDTRLASIASQLLLAPVQRNVKNLIEEGYTDDNIRCVGSLSSDALRLISNSRPDMPYYPSYPHLSNGKWLRVDVHRRENMTPGRLGAVLGGMQKLARDGVKILFVKTNAFESAIRRHNMSDLVELVEKNGVVFTPLWDSYAQVIQFLKSDSCLALYTDSGGLQEECHILGVPCITCRYSTDRPETILESRTNLLVPPLSGEFVYSSISRILNSDLNLAFPALGGKNIYGDSVGNKIAGILNTFSPGNTVRAAKFLF